jgi:hypothetical protein
MKSIVCTLLLIVSLGANAVQVVTSAEIVGVENTSGGTDEFVVHLRGGSGPCANSYVRFYRVKVDALNSGNGAEVLKRAYSSALSGLATGYKVDIATVTASTSCDDAVWIKLYK